MNSLEELVVSAQADFIAAADAAALENAKARYLGKTGQITEMMKGLGKLDPDARKAQAVKDCLGDDAVTPDHPASILKTHPDATIFLDAPAASLLNK